jgi:hypothetical protein
MSIEYYEAQYSKSKKAMENKNAQLWKKWREDFDKRQSALTLRQEGGVVLPYVDDNTPREELDSWNKS